MKEEHKQALMDGKILKSPTGRLSWYNGKGYFNCYDPDCYFCEDWDLTWENMELWYGYWKEDEWKIDD